VTGKISKCAIYCALDPFLGAKRSRTCSGVKEGTAVCLMTFLCFPNSGEQRQAIASCRGLFSGVRSQCLNSNVEHL
jgi:hypothetical protein